MKQIPAQFNEVLRLSREFWESGDSGNNALLRERIKVAQGVRDDTGIDWLAIIDFIDCIIRPSGFVPGASDEMLFILLRVLGWEVVEDVKEHPAD